MNNILVLLYLGSGLYNSLSLIYLHYKKNIGSKGTNLMVGFPGLTQEMFFYVTQQSSMV